MPPSGISTGRSTLAGIHSPPLVSSSSVRTQEKASSSDSRFRRKLSGTTGHRLLGTQRPQMLCGSMDLVLSICRVCGLTPSFPLRYQHGPQHPGSYPQSPPPISTAPPPDILLLMDAIDALIPPTVSVPWPVFTAPPPISSSSLTPSFPLRHQHGPQHPGRYPQALVCLSNREIVDASRGRTFHCKMANNRVIAFFL